MPSSLHETLVDLLRRRPAAAVDLVVAALGVELPVHSAVRLAPAEAVTLVPTEHRADVVLTLAPPDGPGPDDAPPAAAVVLEVQLSRDAEKRVTWPVYLATLRARLGCPVLLVVLCVDAGVAGWCATPIPLGHPGFTLVPLVLGPDRLPVVDEVSRARAEPELAVVSALAHGGHPDRRPVLDALVEALAALPTGVAVQYASLVLASLPDAARRHLEALMATETFEYESEWTRTLERRGWSKGHAEGHAEGVATAVLTVLDARGLPVPEALRARIAATRDPEVLATWLRRAATVGDPAELVA